jgi:hypothetical protein
MKQVSQWFFARRQADLSAPSARDLAPHDEKIAYKKMSRNYVDQLYSKYKVNLLHPDLYRVFNSNQ